MRHPSPSTRRGSYMGRRWGTGIRASERLFLPSEAECSPRAPPVPSSEAQSRAILIPHFDLWDRVGKALHGVVDAPSIWLNPLQPPLGLFGTDRWSFNRRLSPLPSCWLLSAPLPEALPSAYALSPASPITAPPPLLLATYPGQQRRSRGGRSSQAGVAGLRDPQASSTSGLVRLGVQQSWGTRSHLGGPQTPPYFLPSPAGDGLHWPHCRAFRGSSCQCASGCEQRGTAPCTCGGHNTLERSLLGWGKKASPRPGSSLGACCVQVVRAATLSFVSLCPY